MIAVLGWIYFVLVQLINLLATIVGWVLLIPLCLLHLWSEPNIASIKTYRFGLEVDKWLLPINAVYGNPEDGVSGQQALVWGSGSDAGKLVSYMPHAKSWFYDAWRAYKWSALRNSTDGLKYVFSWKNGPYKKGSFQLFGRTINYQFGWKPENNIMVPVVSLK